MSGSSDEIYSAEAEAKEAAKEFESATDALEAIGDLVAELKSEISSWQGSAAEQAKASAEEMDSEIADMAEASETLTGWITLGWQTFTDTDDSLASSWLAE